MKKTLTTVFSLLAVSLSAQNSSENLSLPGNIVSNSESVSDTYDIYISDYKGDTGARPYDRNTVYWSSPDIWCRFNDDGIEHQVSENIRFTEDHDICYVYARVKNRGSKPYVYNANNPLFVHFYWSNSSFAISEKQWRGYIDSQSEKGGYIGRARLKGTINPGETQVVKVTWQPHDDTYDQLVAADKFHACLLASISNTASIIPEIVEDTTNIIKIWSTNKVAQRNVVACMAGGKEQETIRVGLGELGGPSTGDLMLTCVGDKSSDTSVRGEISLRLSPSLYKSLQMKKFPGSGISNTNPNNELILKAGNSRIEGISMKKGNSDYIDFGYSVVADKTVTDTVRRTLDFALTDRNGNYLGGESFEIINVPRERISLSTAVSATADGKKLLRVTDVSEGVTYEWYDSNGNYLGSGSTLSVSSGISEKQYTVKVKSEKDGAVNYETVTVPKSSGISSVDTRYKDGMNITLEKPALGNTTIQVVSPTSVSSVKSYSVEEGSSSCVISIPNMESGVYQVSLLEGNEIIDTRKVIKR